MPAPTLAALVQDAHAQLGLLSRHLLDRIQDELGGRPQQHALLDAWQRQRLRFAERFEQALTPLLEAAARGEDPLHRKPVSIDTLSLVDEQQALQDVAVAHVIQAVDDHCRAELHQLGNFFAALRGTARPRKQDNPLRPALFAQALLQALRPVQLDAEGQYALMRAAAQPLAQGLGRLYGQLCAQLRAAELTPLIAGSTAMQQSDQQRLRRAASIFVDSGPATAEPVTLDSLARRVDAYNSRPQRLGPAVASGATGKDMLSRLYDQILADPELLPPVKALLARLQVAVARLAMSDISLLRRQDHPAWQLLNRVAAHGAAFERADDAGLQQFLQFMDQHISSLLNQPQPSAAQFLQLLGEVDAHIGAQARQRSESSASALALLEREQRRQPWLALLREQVQAQLDDAPDAQTTPLLRQFLDKVWTRVIVQAMVEHGQDAPQAHAQIALVDQLLDSLRLPADEAQRLRRRAELPALIQRLQAGCDSVALPPPQRQSLFDELMRLHGRLLLGHQVAAPQPEQGPKPDADPEARLRQLLSERESQMPSRWAHEAVDRGRLPTVPVTLYDHQLGADPKLALQTWIESLRIGAWYHMFVQSQWLTAQLAWVSDSRQFFLFVGQDADERHSLTRGALEQLLAHGLIAVLEEDDLVQRAVATLMQDLNDEA
ncbi:DUF1631 family protein [Paucibacter sp. PLA-PC-4]|uniref:DUF1631 family protein n=1 Tax=Paucibacter sp. PLA-PC-4 TaxID=2993655 RepID=UPI0022487C27|nr:DUF1631 family protein [Paucibacter sp. PLA-PC-4]MCX2863053.1 DUF1631 family protein [Paucibacter sp. PLA-PC-4]